MPKGGFRNFKQRGGNIDTKAFMESNSLVARAAFVLLVLLVFIVAISIGTTILKWFFSPSKNPKIIDGMKPGTQAMTVSANPQKPGAKPILRSDNKRYGVEFTWSVWLYILDLQYKKGEKKHIFHKGNDQLNSHGMPSATQCPGLYLHETKNALVIVVSN